MEHDIQIISAPSILGLKPSGVEELSERLLENGLAERLRSTHPVFHVPTLNSLYTTERDPETNCINALPLKEFSITLGHALTRVVNQRRFPLVLGGDCSILIGIMAALKRKTTCGLVFIDAHADFYLPAQSPTGEIADMELAIVTGRGPDALADIDHLKPYVNDEHVVHIGQRDHAQTKEFHSADIRDTRIHCVDAPTIQRNDLTTTANQLVAHINGISKAEHFWLHFDTDVLSDAVNPAVDYRLPGGLLPDETELLLHRVLGTKRIAGMSVTIYNPRLDPGGQAGKIISDTIVNAFTTVKMR
jgi:arginase